MNKKYTPQMVPIIPDAREYSNAKDPEITFTENMTLNVGETSFQIYHTPGHKQAPGHSDGQLCVYIPEERIAMAGDFMSADYVVRMRKMNLGDYLEALDFLETLDVDWIIPARGAARKKEQILQQRITIFKWLNVVAEVIEKGDTYQQSIQTISFAEQSLLMDIGAELHKENQSEIAVACYDYLIGREMEKTINLMNQAATYSSMCDQVLKKDRERFEKIDEERRPEKKRVRK